MKFTRLCPCKVRDKDTLAVLPAMIDAHSDAIEAHADDLESLSSRVRRLERRSQGRNDKLLAALEEQWGCRIPPWPLQWRRDEDNRGHITETLGDYPPKPPHWARTMTAEEAADIILAEQAKLTRALNDPKLRVWTRAVAALMVGALREHGRDDR